MRIGVFGGTFDPPHLGHLILASEAIFQLKLDKILFMLTPDPPHKRDQPITALKYRLEMVEAIAADDPQFEVSRIEMDRPGPHYTVDTLAILHETYPEDEIIYLIGGDSLDAITTWHRTEEFIARCDQIGVMQRPGTGYDLQSIFSRSPGLVDRLQIISAPLLEIASSDIRTRILQHGPYKYYLPESVFNIIEKYSLYR
ncbi:MAG: nicotinate (nicotinamide) nucleotide adenylyltransferase [Anaerolineales bacterium]|nr:nicotinate (nicotinamide) nucleotide adenylyltransferase [Anaerolineales bacterium]